MRIDLALRKEPLLEMELNPLLGAESGEAPATTYHDHRQGNTCTMHCCGSSESYSGSAPKPGALPGSTVAASISTTAVSSTANPPRILRGSAIPGLLRDELLSEIFAATVHARPHHPALVTADRTLSYSDLDAASDAIARGLIAARGVGPGSVVGLWMPRGVDLLIGQLAITKTGAAWLPFDAAAPVQRVATCLTDASATCLLTSALLAADAAAAAGTTCPVLVNSDVSLRLEKEKLPGARARGTTPEHPAYLIYTSGSTGVPKGTIITQRNICHAMRATNEVYRVTSADVHYQGISLAFDMCMEEIWIPYIVGATLYVGVPEVVRDTEALPGVLEAAGVTVLNTVPTLLSLLPRDVQSLRMIIVGGEACPASLVDSWWRPGRAILNSYGPTEASVVTSVSTMTPGQPVTIGPPIPNYSCYVVGEIGQLVPRGAEGELLIGGPGVARGYLNRDELTAQKFIPNPFPDTDGSDPILYRSGDLVSVDDRGDLVYRGRADNQVKVRGFRIELGEIEAALCALPWVREAAVVVRRDSGIEELVAFVSLAGAGASGPGLGSDLGKTSGACSPGLYREGCQLAESLKEARASLSKVMPACMVPQRMQVVEALPRLHSGKIDRKTLVEVDIPGSEDSDIESEEPGSYSEARLLEAAKSVLPPSRILLDADFFTDLGGHSLLAARFVSAVRQDPRLQTISLQDVYMHRTLRAMAEHLDRDSPSPAESPASPKDSPPPPPLLRRFLCGLAQAVVLPFILALSALWWLGVLVLWQVAAEDLPLLSQILSFFLVFIATDLTVLAICVLGKWLVLGRTKPGRYPLWGTYYFRWWLAQRLVHLPPSRYFQGSPLMGLYLWALGAEVGSDTFIGDVRFGAACDLLSIGQGTTLGNTVNLANARVEGGELVIGSIRIGSDALIGSGSTLLEGVVVGSGAVLKDLTALAEGVHVADLEVWDGAPGRCVGKAEDEGTELPAPASLLRRVGCTFFYTVAVLVVPTLSLMPLIPAMEVFDQARSWAEEEGWGLLVFALTWPAAMAFDALTVLSVAGLRWVIMPGKVKPGMYSVWSWFYLRKWAVGLSSLVGFDTLPAINSTLYMRLWHWLMGSDMRWDTEVSGIMAGPSDLIHLGSHNFVADDAVLGDEFTRRGWVHLHETWTGDRVFIGNDAVVPLGSVIPSNVLVGVRSKLPEHEKVKCGETWFGSPPLCIPSRHVVHCGDESLTFSPPAWRVARRAAYEALSISLPTAVYISYADWAVPALAAAVVAGNHLQAAVGFVTASAIFSLLMMLTAVAVKWCTTGVVRAQVQPMWSFWVTRVDCNGSLFWAMASMPCLEHLQGTPFLPWCLRLFGARTGGGVFIDTVDFTEPDLISLGDFSSLNMGVCIQGHLFEDRIMKLGTIKLGRGVTLDPGSLVMHTTEIGEGARLGPHSMVMSGEEIPPESHWTGCPARMVLSAHKANRSLEV